jgi:6-pyruvoyltetrahydropterin/6-carboxytetrahydropterin synthase
MYEVSLQYHFDAAHYLRGYHGKCEKLHGHRFQVAVRVRTHEVDSVGLAYDFATLKQQLSEVLGKFDHALLNEIPPFDDINPSSENIAATIYHEFYPKLPKETVALVSVQVWESPECWVTYYP